MYIIGAANEAGGAGFIGVFFVRTILLGFGHATFTALTGLGFGLFVTMQSDWRWLMPLLGLVGGMLCGGEWVWWSWVILVNYHIF